MFVGLTERLPYFLYTLTSQQSFLQQILILRAYRQIILSIKALTRKTYSMEKRCKSPFSSTKLSEQANSQKTTALAGVETPHDEVALDYNAGFTGAIARMYDKFGGDPLSDSQLNQLPGISVQP